MIKQLRTRSLVTALLLLAADSMRAQTPVRIVVNANLGETTINRHIYGHFGEDLGRLIYDGFWTKSGTGQWHLRDDVIDALRQIQIPSLRWPGGCFSEYYHWRDGIGPREKRRPMGVVIRGGVVQDNSFGTHEYMELIRRLGAEPFIVGNVGSGTVAEMMEWWQYLNEPTGPLADERARNGHPQPFNVRFWGIGNENWGCGGNMTAPTYATLYKQCVGLEVFDMYKVHQDAILLPLNITSGILVRRAVRSGSLEGQGWTYPYHAREHGPRARP